MVIENQLERSNHDHLGKLITDLTVLEAKTAIWIVSEPRPEHVRAIGWLNESPLANFWLLKVEAVRIGDSDAAPLFNVIVRPSAETRGVGDTKQELAERHHLRRAFWQALLDRARPRTRLHSGISPSKNSYIGTGAGRSGLSYNYVVRKDGGGMVELYIDRGRGAEEEIEAIFDALLEHRERIEAEFGESLEWERLEQRRACRIRKTISGVGYRADQDAWGDTQDSMVDAMVRLERALKPHIDRLPV